MPRVVSLKFVINHGLVLRRVTAALLASLLISQVQAAAPPGHPTTGQAAEILQLPASTAIRAVGTVRQAIDSNAYTYVQVALADGSLRWLAVPRRPLVIGSRIGIGEGTLMHNFYSKKLSRYFGQVLFVQAVVPME